MKGISKIKSYIYFYINKLIIFQIISIFQSQLINNIIKLGDNNFRYSHVSFKSNGDMIRDTSSLPVSSERRFFGLKQNGNFYFKSEDNSETPYYNMTIDHSKGRIEGESYFIKLSSSDSNINGIELICGISKIGQNDRGY